MLNWKSGHNHALFKILQGQTQLHELGTGLSVICLLPTSSGFSLSVPLIYSIQANYTSLNIVPYFTPLYLCTPVPLPVRPLPASNLILPLPAFQALAHASDPLSHKVNRCLLGDSNDTCAHVYHHTCVPALKMFAGSLVFPT